VRELDDVGIGDGNAGELHFVERTPVRGKA
jgi:hypothetical protein